MLELIVPWHLHGEGHARPHSTPRPSKGECTKHRGCAMVATVHVRDAKEHHFSFWSSSTTDVDRCPWANTPYAMDRRGTPELEVGGGVRSRHHYFF